MARPAKAAQTHWLHGTRAHEPQLKSHVESHVPPGRPRFPKDLPPEARSVFRTLVKLLAERRALTKGDHELLRLYCMVWDRHQRQHKKLLEEGEICTYVRLDSNGEAHDQVKVNLRLKIVEQAEKQMVAILDRLGLTPNARDRVKPTGGSPVEEIVPGSLADKYPEVVAQMKKEGVL